MAEVIFGEPSDVGFGCISRRRAFQLLLRRDAGRWIRDPLQVYLRLCRGLADKQLTLAELCQLGSASDLAHELSLIGKTVSGYPENLLSTFEKTNKEKYEQLLGDEGGRDQQAYCLGQKPDCINKSTTCGVLPCFTHTDKIQWIPAKSRHLLAIEKFAGHSFGVSNELAALLGTPVS